MHAKDRFFGAFLLRKKLDSGDRWAFTISWVGNRITEISNFIQIVFGANCVFHS
jgi:hypothetical protein